MSDVNQNKSHRPPNELPEPIDTVPADIRPHYIDRRLTKREICRRLMDRAPGRGREVIGEDGGLRIEGIAALAALLASVQDDLPDQMDADEYVGALASRQTRGELISRVSDLAPVDPAHRGDQPQLTKRELIDVFIFLKVGADGDTGDFAIRAGPGDQDDESLPDLTFR